MPIYLARTRVRDARHIFFFAVSAAQFSAEGSIARGPRRITHELTYLACPFLYFSSFFIRDCYSEAEGHLYSGSEKPQ